VEDHMQTTRQEIFAQAAKKLRHDFEELSATVVHSGLKGGEAEDPYLDRRP
jgi:hypothetical protein